jgi:uroporphyrinogen-III decarboxylase
MLAWQNLIGDDRLMAYFDMMVEAAGFGQRMVFQDDQPAYSDKQDLVIKTPDDYAKLERYDVEKAERIRMTLDVAEILQDERGDTVPVAAIVAEPLVVLGLLRGMEALLMDCMRARTAGTVRDAVDTAMADPPSRPAPRGCRRCRPA